MPQHTPAEKAGNRRKARTARKATRRVSRKAKRARAKGPVITIGRPLMPKAKPRTKAGKRAKVGRVLSEFKAGALRSSSGQTVTKRKQAVAIALSESGRARKRKKKKS